MNMQIQKAPSLFPRRLLPLLSIVFSFFLAPDSILANSVVSTKHNLSTSGPGPIKSASEEQVCIFCHTPHHANVDINTTHLWSRDLSANVYDLYGSTTMKAVPEQPRGYSRLCLSCHDGTIALGVLHGGRTIGVSGTGLAGGKLTAANRGFLGEDLSDDHPISFDYTPALANSNGELKQPNELPAAIKLQGGTSLECTSCHNPHSAQFGKFLVMGNSLGQMCKACHVKTGWAASSHGGHQNPLNATTSCTVCHDFSVGSTENVGCQICHKPHRAGISQRLLRNATEEGTCLRCHTAGKAQDIQTAINKSSIHPVADPTTIGVHYPNETLPATMYHVECADCHNPHQIKDAVATAPAVNGRLTGVKGVKIDGAVINPADNEYEVCFRCHASSNTDFNTNTVDRKIEEGNKRLSFLPTNPSFHPVAAVGRNTNVPGLLLGYTEASMIYCTDCHNNDTSVKAGGTGANGPHGSQWKPLLISKYNTTTSGWVTYAPAEYALCFRCHSDTTLRSSASGFYKTSTSNNLHSNMGHQRVSCSVCHDPHGVPGGTETNNSHLINFGGQAKGGTYTHTATGGSCFISGCHGNKSYAR